MKTRIIVIGIVLGLVVCGLLLYRSGHHRRQISRLNACIGNLRIYDAAKEQWAMANGKVDGDDVVIEEVMKYIKGARWDTERCPAVGRHTYTLGRIGEDPTCSVHGSMEDLHLPDGTKSW